MMRVARLRQQINAQNTAEPDSAEQKTPAAEEAPAEDVVENKGKPRANAARKTPKAKRQASTEPEVTETAALPEEEMSIPDDDSSRNLALIGEALYEYATRSSTSGYMTHITRNDDFGDLSWRVHLLPYLGYDDLYKKFDLEVAWDQSPNKELISLIPEIYQSDGMSGPNTRYLAVVGKGSLMDGRRETKHSQWSKLAEKSVLVIESDSYRGVVWTKPDDFDYTRRGALQRLGRLRNGYVYAIWGDGFVRAIDMSKARSVLSRVFAFKNAGPVDVSSIVAPFDADKMAANTRQSTATPSVAAGDTDGSSTRGGGGELDAGSTDAWGFGGFGDSETASANQLATSCLSAARLARSTGVSSDAWNWLQGAAVADLPFNAWQQDMRWVPALRRPSLGVHWAVGVSRRGLKATGPVSVPVTASDAKRERSDFIRATQPNGEPLLAVIEKAAASAEPAAISPKDPESLSPVTYLSKSPSTAELLNMSTEVGADVLAIFSIEEVTANRSEIVEVALYDVMRRRQLQKITSPQRRSSQDADQRGTASQKLKWELGDYVEDALTPTDWPTKLTKRLAAMRTKALGKMETAYPPQPILEMRYYRNLGLTDDAQLLAAVNSLIGGEQGVNLLLGSETKKRRVLRQWLPNDDPAAYVAEASSRRRQADDEDD